MNPSLRPIKFQSTADGYLLQDPLQFSEYQLQLPYALARIASLCDGSFSAEKLHHQLCLDTGQTIPFQIIEDLLAQLDELYLLDNERSRALYLDQPYRPPAYAGLNYPADPAELSPFLEAYSEDDTDLAHWQPWEGRALVAPHIDYQRGGKVYAKAWQRAKQAIQAADLILIFGTDHKARQPSLTLCQLPYATPYGVLPTDETVLEELANAIGEKNAFQHEFNHCGEHSIELAAVWLHHLRPVNPCPVIPILIGSFYQFTPHGHPLEDPNIVNFLAALKKISQGKRVFAVASVDLAHVGPAFDSDYKMDTRRRQALAQSDSALMDAIVQGDTEQFYQQLARHRNANNVCGFSPTYLLLKYLEQTQGIQVAYDQCSADAQNTSVVSICGILLD